MLISPLPSIDSAGQPGRQRPAGRSGFDGVPVAVESDNRLAEALAIFEHHGADTGAAAGGFGRSTAKDEWVVGDEGNRVRPTNI